MILILDNLENNVELKNATFTAFNEFIPHN